MSGVSVGWFEPESMWPNPAELANIIRATFGPRLRKTRAWPLAVSSIRWEHRGVGVAYALVGGHVPIHIDSVGLPDSDGRVFQFVLETENRPALLAGPATDTNRPIFDGFAPPTTNKTFGLGGMELIPGMAVHFDITAHYHGITAMPVQMASLKDDLTPRAVIVQVAGFDAHEIGRALEHAALWIGRDIAASSR